MGTDIHGVWQKKVGDKWVGVSSNYSGDRHYRLFSVLAGVRNGAGFAGLKYGDAVTPISYPRGLPEDFQVSDDHNPTDVCMGDHSFSWLTGKEMLEWYRCAPTVKGYGILSRKEYTEWDKQSVPREHFGDVYGYNVVIVNMEDAHPNNHVWSHVRCSWNTDLKKELGYFFSEVQRLVDEHGDIRFVFGFDS